jgi:ComF family protein
MLKELLAGCLDLLAPPRCAACTQLLEARITGFCDACAPLLETADDELSSARDAAACVYGGPLRDALHRLKYEAASELVPALARLLEQPARGFAGRVDCVAVVPLHPRRLRERGYNQSALLARPVARALGVPLLPSLLVRTRDTRAQVGQSRNDRVAQLSGVFRASSRARSRTVLVVDDVRTSGATLAEARRALYAAEARDVYTLALAATPGDAAG